MRASLSALLIFGLYHASCAEFFLHRIKSWRWNNIICEACKWDYHPVCGTDGKTYRNGCTLMCSARRHDAGLSMIYRGECSTRRYKERSLYREGCEQCSQQPPSVVCASNGITFQSVCYFDCYQEETGDSDLKIVHPGPCLVDELTGLKGFHDQVGCICNSETGEGKFIAANTIGKNLKIKAGWNVYNKCGAEGKLHKGFCEDSILEEDDVRNIRSYNPCGCSRDEDKVCVRYPNLNVTQVRKNKCYAECEREAMTDMEDCKPKNCDAGFDPHCATMVFRDLCHFDCFRLVKDPRITYLKIRRRRKLSPRQRFDLPEIMEKIAL